MRHVMIVLVLALLVACAAPAEEVQEEEQEQPGAAAPEEEPQEAPEESSGDVREEFESFFASADQEYMVEYDVNTQEYSGVMTMYLDGGDVRMDSVMGGVESRTFMTGGGVIVCSNDGSWDCFEFSSQDEAGVDDDMDPTSYADLEEESSVSYDSSSTRTILGVEARCFSITQEGVSQEMCFAPSGAMLYLEAVYEDYTLTYEATDYASSVSDADFEPPATPQSMEEMMAGYDMPDY